MRVLGIDPGFARLGWGVVEGGGNNFRAIEFGCFETEKKVEFGQRLVGIAGWMETILDQYKPEMVVIEDLFFAANTKTAIDVAQARGVVVMTCGRQKIRTETLTPLQVKMALTGYGRAEKKQVEIMVCKLLGLAKSPKLDDTADALGIAIAGLLMLA